MSAPDPDSTTGANVAAVLAGWWPQGVRRDDAVAVVAVPALKALVTAGEPRTAPQARQALSATWAFLAWRAARETAVDFSTPTALLSAALVDAYKADTGAGGLGARPEGSRSAVSSYLYRLASPGGLAAVHRDHGPRLAARAEALSVQSAAAAAESAVVARLAPSVQLRLPMPATTPVDPVLGVLEVGWPHLDPLVAAVVATVVPETLAPDIWERVAPLVRAAVARSNPQRPKRARAAVTVVGYLAAWVDGQRRPVRSDVVFAPETIAAFLRAWATGGESSAASLGTYRTLLGLVGAAVLPDVDFSGLPRFPRVRAKAGATDAEVSLALAWADHRVKVHAKRHSRAAVVLARSCGADAGVAPWVRPADVSDDGAWVDFHAPSDGAGERFVRAGFVVPAWRDALRQVASAGAKAGDTYLIGGSSSRRSHRLSALVSGAPVAPPVTFTQLRNAWMVDVVEGRHLNLFEFMDAAGLGTLRVVEDLFDVPGRGRDNGDESDAA